VHEKDNTNGFTLLQPPIPPNSTFLDSCTKCLSADEKLQLSIFAVNREMPASNGCRRD